MTKRKLSALFFSFLFIAVIVVSVLMFKNALQYDVSCSWNDAPLYRVAIQGEYKEEDGIWKPFTKDIKFDYKELRDITVRGHFTRDLPKGNKLYLKIDQLKANMRINGEEVLQFEPQTGDGNPTNAIGRMWYTYISPGITTEDIVELNFGNLYRNAYYIQFDELLWDMRTGSESGLLFASAKEDALLLLMGSVFLFLSLLLIIISLFCGILHIKGAQQFLWLGLSTFFSALWFITLCPSLSLIWPVPVFFNILYSYSIQGIAAFILLFVASNLSGYRKRLMYYFLGLLMTILVIDMVKQISGVQDLFTAINYFSILDIVLGCCMFIFLKLEVDDSQSKELKNVLRAMLLLVVFGILELINGYLQFTSAATCFGLGLISFAVLEGVFLLLRIQASMKNEKRALTLENELIQSQVSVMLSQIQPHFLYNSLMGIKELCDVAPPRAADALEHFAYFLRGNLDSLADTHLIPFEKEIEHVQDYLHLEKMRFQDILTVVWETPYTDYLLPPLTLQPIVENAVRYGITKKDNGGTITIKSKKTDDAVIITVCDDGVGFDTNAPLFGGRSHIGLDNVRSRLAAQCGGTLTVQSKQDVGTTVTVYLPQKEIL